MNIGGVYVGDGSPCRFIVELSNCHNGDLTLAHRLVDAAKVTGAEFVKFQAFVPDELVALRGNGPAPAQWGAQGWSMRELYTKAQTPLEWLPELFQHARDIGIVPFASVFGLTSMAALRDVDCPAYKIAALDNRHVWLIDAAHAMGKPVLVSSHTATPIARTIRNIVPLYCPAGYPTPIDMVAVPEKFLLDLAHAPGDTYRGCFGLSSHCLHPDLPTIAVARGAKIIEMHMQLADEPSELEANISLTEHQFADMIRRVRDVEVMLS